MKSDYSRERELAMGGSSLPDALQADLVLMNGKIVTVDAEDSLAEAVAVRDNKILAVGRNEEVMETAGARTRMVDLRGRTVVPGLTDVHLHMMGAGLSSLREFKIPSTSIRDVLEVVRERAAETPKGEWLKGGNVRFAHIKFAEKRWPTRWELDEAAPDHLVFLHFGPHIKAVNSRVLELAGITGDTPDPLGGTIVRDPETGEPTGVLRETASHLVTGLWPPYTYEDRLEAVRLEGRRCLEEGTTTVHEIVTRADEIRPYLDLLERGELPVRVRLLVRVWESAIDLDELLNIGFESNFGDEWLKIAGVKMSVGGGISGSNAAMYQEYSDEPGNFGVIRIPYPDLVDLISRANEGGLQCAVHALGDRDLDMVINAFEAAFRSKPGRELRHRVEHAGDWLFTPERRRRFRELGLIAVPNINFLYTFGDGIKVTLGPERTGEDIFPLRSMLKEGMLLVSGSDGPNLEPAAPLRDVGTAVLRRTELGVEMNPSEAITVIEALRMFTINAAYIEFEEEVKGSIEPGKLADMTVLDRDPLTVPPEEIKSIRVDMTIIDGMIAYTR
jgi:predicted amidohydrolase YtcJ